ncbi:MAG: hypothetical protein HRT92_05595 [Piscirickettsiaceae bacterium]|nr:hypothetical protein [Piscirickettsiaceae bacterium]
MKTINFPYIALSLSLFLLLVVSKGSQIGTDGLTLLPLLTLLVVSEFSFIVTLIGTYIGIKTIFAVGLHPVYALTTLLCAVLSIRFLLLGIALWPL